MFEKIWDEETVVAAIRGEIIAGNEVSYFATFKRVPSLLRAGVRTFGSWRNAIEATGLNYDDIKKECSSENLFADEIFKADLDSLAYSDNFKQSMQNLNIKWMRPKVSFMFREQSL